jgi:hypothetical protein
MHFRSLNECSPSFHLIGFLLLSFIVLLVPLPRNLSLHSVCYRFSSACKFVHLGMTPLFIFEFPLLVHFFNSLLINSFSLFLLHDPLYRLFPSCLPLFCESALRNLLSRLDHLTTRPTKFLPPSITSLSLGRLCS